MWASTRGLANLVGRCLILHPGPSPLALSCSTSSLRMTASLSTTASRRRNGGTELPPPPRRYALSKPGHLPSSICHTMLSFTRASPGRKRLWRCHEWQAQRIVGERQTPSGLEHEVSLEKTLWLPKATLDTKLVRRYRAGQRPATRVRTRWSSRLQEAGSSVRLQRR
jgi:hypothetical protein